MSRSNDVEVPDEAFFSELVDSLEIELVVLDDQSRFIYINPAAIADAETRAWMIGQTEDTFGRRLGRDPAQSRHRQTMLDRVLARGQSLRYDEQLIHHGQERRIHRHLVPLFDAGGRVRRVVIYGFDVTDRSRIEHELRASEANYRAIFERNRAVKLVIAPDTGAIIDANDAACEFYGCDRSTLCRQSVFDLSRTGREALRQRLQDTLHGQRHRFEGRHLAAGGAERAVEIYASPIRAGDRTQLLAIIHDVTDRDQAEVALRRSEAYFRSIVDNALDVISILDADGAVRFESPSIETVLGHRPDARIGTPWLDAVHEDDRAQVTDVLLRRAGDARADGDAPLTYRVRHHDGGWRTVESRASNLLDHPTVGGVIVHTRDLTAQAEAERARARSDARYERLFAQTRNVVYFCDADGRLLDINQAGLGFFGIDQRDAMLGLPFDDFVVDPQQRARARDTLLAQGHVKDLELRLRTADGSERIAQSTMTTVREADGAITTFGILRDVTGQRRLEDQLRQSQKMEAVGRLAGGVAHEFNNLLTAINGYSDLVLRQLENDNPLRKFVEEVRNAGQRAAALTGKLITLGQRQVVSPQAVDLNRIVTNLESLLRRVIGEDIDLIARPDGALGKVWADAGQIEQAVLNLALNAREAMPGGGQLRITTRNVTIDDPAARGQIDRAPGDYVVLAVEDDGVGIADDVLEHIFEPFFTTKQVSAEGNTGMGLATVYAMVHQSGGFIEVESEVDRGSIFRIVLPRMRENRDERPGLNGHAEPSTAASGETVLVVEDEAAVRLLVRRLLSQEGYRVIEAQHATDALLLLDQRDADAGPIDLLLTDVVMPTMSGPELAETLLERFPDLRVLYISGYTDSFVVQHGLSNAERDIVQKPFDPKVLLRKVREILDG
ncbi:MAG: PAS domain S-box protein [Acidobacteriota bacterium]